MNDRQELRRAVDELLAFLPIFTAPDFEVCKWHGGNKIDGVIQMPYPEYHDEVDRLFVVYSAIYIHPYDLLPEDEPELDLQRLMFTPTYFKTATFDQTRRYFSLIRRRERFHDGYIAGEITSGVLIAALRRLGETREGDVGI